MTTYKPDLIVYDDSMQGMPRACGSRSIGNIALARVPVDCSVYISNGFAGSGVHMREVRRLTKHAQAMSSRISKLDRCLTVTARASMISSHIVLTVTPRGDE